MFPGPTPSLQMPLLPVMESMRRRRRAVRDRIKDYQNPFSNLIAMQPMSNRTDWRKCTYDYQAKPSTNELHKNFRGIPIERVCTVPQMQEISKVTGRTYEAVKTERLMVVRIVDYRIFWGEQLNFIRQNDQQGSFGEPCHNSKAYLVPRL